jgi:hypothetical protein
MQEVAQKGVKMKVAPDSNTVRKKMNEYMPFLVIRHPVDFQSGKTIDLFMSAQVQRKKDPNVECPYYTKSMKIIAQNERCSSPIAYAMNHYTSDTRDEVEQKYIDEHYRKLQLREPQYATNLGYPLKISQTSPIALEIENGLPGVEVNRGYVYAITDVQKFQFDHNTNWQFITYDNSVRVLGRIEVRREDFRHPVRYVECPERLWVRNGR